MSSQELAGLSTGERLRLCFEKLGPVFVKLGQLLATRPDLVPADVAEELKKGEKVQLVGFGTFEVAEREAREGRNPRTGETMTIAASKSPKFKAGKALKDSLN